MKKIIILLVLLLFLAGCESGPFDKTAYNLDGYDRQGYNLWGYNRAGHNRVGHNHRLSWTAVIKINLDI